MRYKDEFTRSKAGACIVSEAYANLAPSTMRLILTPLPYRAYGIIAATFYPEKEEGEGISPHAFIDPTAQISPGVSIGPGTVISAKVVLGEGVQIGPQVVIGPGVEIGEGSLIGPQCVLSHCLIGKRVILYPGVKIGQPGFGFYIQALSGLYPAWF